MPNATELDRILFRFAPGQADGDASMKALLGGKGANLAEMARIGLPVPPGFTLPTTVCTWRHAHGRDPDGLADAVRQGVAFVEEATGLRFGDPEGRPLLLSVRSGARDSMPGMMDTVLDLGLNEASVEALARTTGNPLFAWDSWHRMLEMYGDVVLGVPRRREGDAPGKAAPPPTDGPQSGSGARAGSGSPPGGAHPGTTDEAHAKLAALKDRVARLRERIQAEAGRPVPDDPHAQLAGAIDAVFGSWMNDRAVVYRRRYGIPESWGTAVNVQAMVYGNLGPVSATGVAFTRDPATGENRFWGEYLMEAQGEDVVAGIRTPRPVEELARELPAAHAELERLRHVLERHFRDLQDFEFTVEEGTVYLLQTRNGKRTAQAALRISMEMVEEGLIDATTALLRNPPDQLDHLLAPVFEPGALDQARVLARGLPAGPGAASGGIVFHAHQAVAAAERGESVILVRTETSPDDLRGMIAARGIVTARGGVSSHAALVARQLGRVCVTGASALEVDEEAGRLRIGSETFHAGDPLSVDGTGGRILEGNLPTHPSAIVAGLLEGAADRDDSAQTGGYDARDGSAPNGVSDARDGAEPPPPSDSPPPPTSGHRGTDVREVAWFRTLMAWADEHARLEVRANADTPEQLRVALALGARGVGLARTEHMFLGEDRADLVREMILADSAESRKDALSRLLPLQREDFRALLAELEGRPCTIRLLDPPLHEFLPSEPGSLERLARALGLPPAEVEARIEALRETNPMLGFRGCRLGIIHEEISEMQVEALLEAAADLLDQGVPVHPELMVPLVGFEGELAQQVALIERVRERTEEARGRAIPLLVGTMIEVPRAALVAGAIACHAHFFSFGTNDLTQMALGMSRDDAGRFLPDYVERRILSGDPFQSIDEEGVGALVEMAVARGRATRPGLELGVCGEHGGDPASIRFFHRAGLDYVSCSPFRVPVARLAAAHAALLEGGAERGD
jgi:pyruvate, orthophosphate dikinase